MPILTRLVRGLAASLLLLLLCCASALAVPVTVNVRVEGATKTLFEGPVVTDAEEFETPTSKEVHPCDYSKNGNSEGFENEGNPAGTPTTALRDAALASGLAFDASWFGSGAEKKANPGDFFVTRVGSDVNESSGEFASWGYAVNFTTANVGGCQIALAPGNEVLWAYNYFNLQHRLKLAGATTANAGTPFTVHVSDGGTGEGLAGMSIGVMLGGVTSPLPGSPTTDASGNATISLPQAGEFTLKATGAGAVRSNGLPVCVHNGNDGTCLTTLATPSPTLVATPDVPKIAGIVSGHVFTRRGAPRLLRGVVTVPAGGTLRQVQISLQRRVGKSCAAFSGKRERFVGAHCGTTRFFSVGDSLSFSYLLPARLKPGRYVYDIRALDASGSATTPSGGVSHVVFRVR
jgi:hypothetical protein